MWSFACCVVLSASLTGCSCSVGECERGGRDDVSGVWRLAIERIAANPAYGDLKMQCQPGLVPLGPDPDSRLEEFAHLASGRPPVRSDKTGRLVRTADMSLVFVLIPGGRFVMGAQGANANAPNYDVGAQEEEAPLCVVDLSSFLISKYEMTQGQWRALARSKPGVCRESPGRTTDGWYPLHDVSWEDCSRMLGAAAMLMPTEAQWEYACRSRTSTPWWTGDEERSLVGAANLWLYELRIHDPALAPVGVQRANPFGLHDVHGSLWEWCRDWWASYETPVRACDGLRGNRSSGFRVIRGGSYLDGPHYARSSHRNARRPSAPSGATGVRPSIAVVRAEG